MKKIALFLASMAAFVSSFCMTAFATAAEEAAYEQMGEGFVWVILGVVVLYFVFRKKNK